MSEEFHYHSSTDHFSSASSALWEDPNIEYMNKDEITAYPPYPQPTDRLTPKQRSENRMRRLGLWSSNQLMGRRWSIGCVALEITQRCNLDCTLCYLSQESESVRDIPMAEIFRRIEMIYSHYGANTDVQITGGDPTLRNREELLEIVRTIRKRGMRPTLMTNGIRATRDLLQQLKLAGLEDVAFHVDMTQERKGFSSEIDLNKIRLEYIERTKGLGLSVLFNTTAFNGNFHEIPDLVRFFCEQSHSINFVSFQLQADTGRGVIRKRDVVINPDTVANQIRTGCRSDLKFDVLLPGHKKCNRFATTLVVNGSVYDAFYDPDYIQMMLRLISDVESTRTNQKKILFQFFLRVLLNPRLWLPSLKYDFELLRRMSWDLIRSRGKVRMLSFFVHNFMDACQLEKDRIDACSFMVATHVGPVSMCMHNAKRDEYILKPFLVETTEKTSKYWHPKTGVYTNEANDSGNGTSRKIPLKGQLRAAQKKEKLDGNGRQSFSG